MRGPEKADFGIRKPFGDTGQNIERANSTRTELQKRDRRKERDERNDDTHVVGLSETGCDQHGTASEVWFAVSDIGVTVSEEFRHTAKVLLRKVSKW
jgi:hypothetical protein